MRKIREKFLFFCLKNTLGLDKAVKTSSKRILKLALVLSLKKFPSKIPKKIGFDLADL